MGSEQEGVLWAVHAAAARFALGLHAALVAAAIALLKLEDWPMGDRLVGGLFVFVAASCTASMRALSGTRARARAADAAARRDPAPLAVWLLALLAAIALYGAWVSFTHGLEHAGDLLSGADA